MYTSLITNLAIIAIVAITVISFNYVALKVLDSNHKK